jgi:cytolysin (calcineurin-like family phosphatase)
MSPTIDPYATDAERTLADTFDDVGSDEEEGDGMDDRQRLMRANPSSPSSDGEDHGLDRSNDEVRPRGMERRMTQLPVFAPQPATAGGAGRGQIYGGGQNDGVFANLSAKPTRGEDLEEKPPVRHTLPAVLIPKF